MAARKKQDKVFWALMEKRWFAYNIVALFNTEKEALDARDLIFDQSGLAKSKWSVQRVDLLTFKEFEGINFL